MKKIIYSIIITLISVSITSCDYDDTGLWNEMEEVKDRLTLLEEAIKNTNSDINALQTIVNSLQNNVYVTSVNKTVDGYSITFSNEEVAMISNGKNGLDAPQISIKQDEDTNYYWTLDNEWLLVDGKKVRANGEKGEDAVSPQVRINNTTKEWEISTDGGNLWISTGVVAEGKIEENESNSLFKSVDTSNDLYIVFTLSDGTELCIARYDETMPLFIINDAPEVAQIEYGKSANFVVNAVNVVDFVISKPEGWKVVYSQDLLTIIAPSKQSCHFEKEGIVAIIVVSKERKSAVVKINVATGEWVEESEMRFLTFEDGTERFEPYECEFTYAMMGNDETKWIIKWSDYIPRDGQYGNGHGSYEWYDYNNTELAFVKPTIDSWWGISGHAGISDYVGNDEDIEQYDDDNMLFVIDLQAYNVKGGANGSKNFCTQYGYLDPEEYATQYSPQGVLPGLQFHDGVARVIDHMYVTNTSYTYKILVNGEHDFGGSYEYNDDCTFKVVAYGYDSMDDTEPTTTEFYLLNKNKQIITDWTKWDLSSLGKVVRVEFNLIASDNGYGIYGNVIPAYFAYDDVAVQFNNKIFK